jgi:regulator of sigma E protease
LTVANGAEGATRQIEPLAVGHWFNFVDQEMPPIVNSVQVGQPADKAGIQGGDRFLSVNGAPVETFNKFASIIRVHLDKEMILEIQRGDEVVTLNVTPSMFPLDATQGAIGITAGAAENTKIPGESFGQALAYAPGDTWQTLVNIVELNVQFLRNASFRQIREGVGGPVLIARMTARAAQEGINELVHFFIILNLLLLIFNLLPVPVLDGGFILISVVESVIRRPIPPRVLMPVYTFFVIFFIGLMLVITLWDVKRWIS